LRETIGVPPTAAERVQLAESLATWRAALGEERYKAVWSSGLVLPTEHAIDEARHHAATSRRAQYRSTLPGSFPVCLMCYTRN
jgi:hypothetical protein